jgi:aspartate/methionine/tyrosine aminotransferase
MTSKVAKRVEEFDSGKIRQALDTSKDITDLVDLSIGFPEENTPEFIKQAGVEAIQANHTKYLPTNGLLELRQAISKKLEAENNIRVGADCVSITPGLTTAILLCYLAILNPGDEIILPQPLFPPYFDLAKMIGATPVSIETFPSFQLSAELIEKSITAATKAILVNSPNNPTGAVYAKEELVKIADLAKRHNLIIISDEIYEYFSYDRPHFSIGSIYPDTLTLNGFSKAYAMTGWRVGYVAGPAELIDAINQLQQYIVFSSSSIAQYAALAAFNESHPDVASHYKKKRDLALRVLGNHFKIEGGQGAFYLFIKLPDGVNDVEFVNYLAKNNVRLIPGSAFSARSDYIRLSYAGDIKRLEVGLSRIVDCLGHS